MTTNKADDAIDKLHAWAAIHDLNVGAYNGRHVARSGKNIYAYVDSSGDTFMSLDGSGVYFGVDPKWDPYDIAYDPNL